jgi:hypothetical protein
VLDGQLYVVGGCTTNACTPTSTSVWRYDPAGDAWETLEPYPESTGWLACAGLDGSVVCTGGTDAVGTSTSTYAYDPNSDSWTQRADLPYDNWAMGYDAANGQLVVSGGVTNGFATVTNRSAAYDPAADSWADIEPSNNLVYRGGGACGFYKAGGSTAGFTPSSGVEVHPDFTECDVDTDVPWLSVDPTTATVQPGESITVTVTMDGAVDQPGTYTAGVSIRHDTPYQVDPVGVTMVVAPPKTWGKISGTVTGTDCQGSTMPLAGALVHVEGRRDDVSLRTGADGGYAYWMPANNSPATLIVTAEGYVPQVRDIQFRAGQRLVEDFHLQGLC